jgi:hypothetical protein
MNARQTAGRQYNCYSGRPVSFIAQRFNRLLVDYNLFQHLSNRMYITELLDRLDAVVAGSPLQDGDDVRSIAMHLETIAKSDEE